MYFFVTNILWFILVALGVSVALLFAGRPSISFSVTVGRSKEDLRPRSKGVRT